MSLPTKDQLQKLPKRAQAAFALRCVKHLPAITKWDAIRYVDVKGIDDVIDRVTRFANGKGNSIQNDALVYSAKSVAQLAEQEKKANPPEQSTIRWHTANTSHYIYDFVIDYARTVDELARLDPYQTMEASLSAIRSFAIYSCDGDPSGAVNVAIEDSRQEAVRRIGDDYELLRDIAQRQAWDNNTPAPLALFDTVAQPKEVSHGQGQRRLPTKDREVRTGYQVFISFKNLDENRNPTPDYALAREVFELLTRDGTRTFFSPVSLEEFGTSAFKRAIDDALDQCQVLVAVGTSREHLESEWVRYEWDGFFHDILMGIKPSARIFSYVKGISPSSLPRVLRQNQVFENEHDGLNRLYQYIRGALSLEPG